MSLERKVIQYDLSGGVDLSAALATVQDMSKCRNSVNWLPFGRGRIRRPGSWSILASEQYEGAIGIDPVFASFVPSFINPSSMIFHNGLLIIGSVRPGHETNNSGYAGEGVFILDKSETTAIAGLGFGKYFARPLFGYNTDSSTGGNSYGASLASPHLVNASGIRNNACLQDIPFDWNFIPYGESLFMLNGTKYAYLWDARKNQFRRVGAQTPDHPPKPIRLRPFQVARGTVNTYTSSIYEAQVKSINGDSYYYDPLLDQFISEAPYYGYFNPDSELVAGTIKKHYGIPTAPSKRRVQYRSTSSSPSTESSASQTSEPIVADSDFIEVGDIGNSTSKVVVGTYKVNQHSGAGHGGGRDQNKWIDTAGTAVGSFNAYDFGDYVQVKDAKTLGRINQDVTRAAPIAAGTAIPVSDASTYYEGQRLNIWEWMPDRIVGAYFDRPNGLSGASPNPSFPSTAGEFNSLYRRLVGDAIPSSWDNFVFTVTNVDMSADTIKLDRDIYVAYKAESVPVAACTINWRISKITNAAPFTPTNGTYSGYEAKFTPVFPSANPTLGKPQIMSNDTRIEHRVKIIGDDNAGSFPTLQFYPRLNWINNNTIETTDGVSGLDYCSLASPIFGGAPVGTAASFDSAATYVTFSNRLVITEAIDVYAEEDAADVGESTAKDGLGRMSGQINKCCFWGYYYKEGRYGRRRIRVTEIAMCPYTLRPYMLIEQDSLAPTDMSDMTKVSTNMFVYDMREDYVNEDFSNDHLSDGALYNTGRYIPYDRGGNLYRNDGTSDQWELIANTPRALEETYSTSDYSRDDYSPVIRDYYPRGYSIGLLNDENDQPPGVPMEGAIDKNGRLWCSDYMGTVLYYSKPGNPEAFRPGDEHTFQSPIIGIVDTSDMSFQHNSSIHIIVFTTTQVYGVTSPDSTDEIPKIVELGENGTNSGSITGDGQSQKSAPAGRKSWVKHKGAIYIFGYDGIYEFVGGAFRLISQDRNGRGIKELFTGPYSIPDTSKQRTVAYYNQSCDQIWFSVIVPFSMEPDDEKADQAPGHNFVIAWDLKKREWYFHWMKAPNDPLTYVPGMKTAPDGMCGDVGWYNDVRRPYDLKGTFTAQYGKVFVTGVGNLDFMTSDFGGSTLGISAAELFFPIVPYGYKYDRTITPNAWVAGSTHAITPAQVALNDSGCDMDSGFYYPAIYESMDFDGGFRNTRKTWDDMILIAKPNVGDISFLPIMDRRNASRSEDTAYPIRVREMGGQAVMGSSDALFSDPKQFKRAKFDEPNVLLGTFNEFIDKSVPINQFVTESKSMRVVLQTSGDNKFFVQNSKFKDWSVLIGSPVHLESMEIFYTTDKKEESPK